MKQYLCSHLVKLRWNGRHAVANLERIWRDGATVNSDEDIAIGVAVTIVTEACDLSGRVTASETDVPGHYIDIAFDAGSEWSPDRFQPEHLTDPDIVLSRSLLP